MAMTKEKIDELLAQPNIAVVAVTAPDSNIPSAHLSKLVSLGYVVLTDAVPMVTGDGLPHQASPFVVTFAHTRS